MRRWTTKEVRLVLGWARTAEEDRVSLQELSEQVNHSPSAIKQFLRRRLPPGERPWLERRRWMPEEIQLAGKSRKALRRRGQRSGEAIKKFSQRRAQTAAEDSPKNAKRDLPESGFAVAQVAKDFHRSRRTIQRWLKKGLLRKCSGLVAESSYQKFLRVHWDKVPYASLTPAERDWLVLNGYPDKTRIVKPPDAKEWLDKPTQARAAKNTNRGSRGKGG